MSDAVRSAARDQFLLGCGHGADARSWLPGDASFRRYCRLTAADGATTLLMDAPPPQEDVRPFVFVAERLLSLGLRAPRLLARDLAQGFLLLEDFGDRTFTRALAEGDDEAALYARATDALIALHRHGAVAAEGLPPYDLERLQLELALFLDWHLPHLWGRTPDAALRERWRAVWGAALAEVAADRSALVLRDYHVDNLMAPADDPSGPVGLLDFQDALAGAPEYDLVSLIGDCRRDVDPSVAAACAERWRAAFPDRNAEDLARRCALLSAQRNVKILGIFVRLAKRDGKQRYLSFIPRLWRLLETDLAHPALAEPRRLLAELAPPALRLAHLTLRSDAA